MSDLPQWLPMIFSVAALWSCYLPVTSTGIRYGPGNPAKCAPIDFAYREVRKIQPWTSVSFLQNSLTQPALIFVALALVAALVVGLMDWRGLAPMVALAGVTCWLAQHSARKRYVGASYSSFEPLKGACFWSVVFGLSLSLALHAWPGFTRHVVSGTLYLDVNAFGHPEKLSVQVSYSVDKLLAGLLLFILLSPKIRSGRDGLRALRVSTGVFFFAIVAVFGLALLLGVDFLPKWQSSFWGFALVNLFATVVAEECFFRVLIQDRLAAFKWLSGIVAATITAGLFAAAHWSAQASGVFLTLVFVAGFFYAWIYARSGRIEIPILLHFSVNIVHLLLFEYPLR